MLYIPLLYSFSHIYFFPFSSLEHSNPKKTNFFLYLEIVDPAHFSTTSVWLPIFDFCNWYRFATIPRSYCQCKNCRGMYNGKKCKYQRYEPCLTSTSIFTLIYATVMTYLLPFLFKACIVSTASMQIKDVFISNHLKNE